MSVLRLTSKLLSAINDTPSPDMAAALSPIGDWYGSLFTTDRRKCILFINEPTLFVCLALDVAKSEYRQIIPFFFEKLISALRIESFSKDEIGLILGLHESLTVGRTLNRSTVGSLNNRVQDAKCLIEVHGGLDSCLAGHINRMLNDTPMKAIGYSKGIEKMRALVAGLRK
jgi:hypothetical protein